MESDEAFAIACTAVLPFFAALMGASQPTIIIVTVGYVAASIALVKYKHYLRRHQ